MKWIGYFFSMMLCLGGLTVRGQHQIAGQWQSVKMGGGGFVSSIVSSTTEQNLHYARTDVGGAYRWEESNQEWVPLLDWISVEDRALMGVESFALDPNNSARLYLLAGMSGYSWTGSSVLISHDYGQTFDRIPLDIYVHGNSMGRQTGEKLVVDPNDSNILYMGTSKNGVLKSTDGGYHWTELANFPVQNTPNENGVVFVLVDKTSGDAHTASQTLYAGVSKTGQNLYVSHDAGESWTAISNAPTTNGIMPHRAVLTADGEKMFLTYADGAGPHAQQWGGVSEPMRRGAVFALETSSNTFTDISPMNLLTDDDAWGCYGGITLNLKNEDEIYVSTINHWGQQQVYTNGSDCYADALFVSRDGGNQWTNLFAGDLPMQLSTNGVNWISGHQLHWVGSLALDPFNANRLFATSGNGVFRCDNLNGDDRPIMDFSAHGIEETVPLDMVSIEKGPLVSIVLDYDGWVHAEPEQFPTGTRHAPHMGNSSGIAYAYQDHDVLVRAGSSNGMLYYSHDLGTEWTAFSNIEDDNSNGKVAVSMEQSVMRVLWVSENSNDRKLWLTVDEGAHWENIWTSAMGNLSGTKPVADPNDPSVFYLYSVQKQKIFKIEVQLDGQYQISEYAAVEGFGNAYLAASTENSGEFWVAIRANGLAHVQNGQVTYLENIAADAVAVGKAYSSADSPTLFVWGTIKDTTGMYRSTDGGASWYLINDEEHQFGGLGNGNFVVADNNVFGRVYMSTAGRGIVMGNSASDTLNIDQDLIRPEEPPLNLDPQSRLLPCPNPFKQVFVLENHSRSEMQVEVWNMQGKRVFSASSSESMTLGKSWTPGVYLLFVVVDGQKISHKVLKQ
ncbi:T9SS type A sorting domain-containing protein [Persicobacter diffluens]|uniref:Secretion system C-terminal sorting domain-containing protein n=1 Tax=Persicobacter diffluens TaxID=981 RepID=A0AAN5AM96_9BACT|nr:hypothetical protein PEDI_47310 [Persicobacter diffluens]